MKTITRFFLVLCSFVALSGPIGAADLSLSWNDNSTNEDGFIVERSVRSDGTAPIVWARIATTPKDAKAYNDTGLTPGSIVSYRVAAFNAAGVSGYAGPVTITLPTLPPAPDGLRATIVSIVVTITTPPPAP